MISAKSSHHLGCSATLPSVQLRKMKVNNDDIDKHFKGLHGDGQIKQFKIAETIQHDYDIMKVFFKLQDLAHNIENIFERVQ